MNDVPPPHPPPSLQYVQEQEALCKTIARVAHHNQLRRGAVPQPYVTHPERVAASLVGNRIPAKHPFLICTAWLHDTLEDCEILPCELINWGVDEQIVDNVQQLTHIEDECYESYIDRIIRASDLVRCVKIADIVDNLTDDPKPSQIVKYRKALMLLAGVGS